MNIDASPDAPSTAVLVERARAALADLQTSMARVSLGIDALTGPNAASDEAQLYGATVTTGGVVMFNAALVTATAALDTLQGDVGVPVPAPARLRTVADLDALAPYVPIHGECFGGMAQVLAHKSPNGIWWSTHKNPTTADDLLRLCTDGFVRLAPQGS